MWCGGNGPEVLRPDAERCAQARSVRLELSMSLAPGSPLALAFRCARMPDPIELRPLLIIEIAIEVIKRDAHALHGLE